MPNSFVHRLFSIFLSLFSILSFFESKGLDMEINIKLFFQLFSNKQAISYMKKRTQVLSPN